MKGKIGLVLSGGGVRALGHVGFIKALLEEGIVPDGVSGTSGGALVAALYAYGYSIDDMLNFFRKTPLLSISLYTFNKPGLMDSEKYYTHFKKFFPEDNFDTLKYPTYISATNLLSGKLDFFSEGELINPLIASSALPPVFSPVEINGNLYSDGGILNNFPIEPLENNFEKIIGSFVNPLKPTSKSQINSTIKLIYRVYHIGLDANDIRKFSRCNYVLTPVELSKVNVLDRSMVNKAFQIGYKLARKEMPQIKKAIL